VLELNREKRRLKLGMKQLEPDAQDETIAELKLGEMVTGRVVKVVGRDARVEIGEGVQAVCRLEAGGSEPQRAPRAAAPAGNVSSLGEMLQAAWKGAGGDSAAAEIQESAPKPGQVRSFKVVKLDPKSRTIELALV
jgi:small subunit ribosomal protein S1